MRVNSPKRGKSSSPRTAAGSRTARGSGRVTKKKPKKQDNTKLFIGIGVGVFFLLIMIIGIANSGSSSSNANYSTSKSEPSFSLPKATKVKIYKEYIKADNKLEDEASAKTAELVGDEIREKGKSIRSEKNRKLQNVKVDMINKYKKKYEGFSSSYFKKIINEGIDKNW
ncbi:MAG: hypothetical protein NE334_03060 [Lentisphaeraceae bacterium]|nr:hypothetical protein [Lentisphaeraceae bacterium]